MLDNNMLAFAIAAAVLFILFTGLFIFLTIKFRRKLNEHHYEKQKLLIAKLEEGERIMNEIATTIHDDILQIAHLLYSTHSRIKKTDDKKERDAMIDHSNILTDIIIDNSDNIQRMLNGDFLKSAGLSCAIENTVSVVTKSTKIVCKVDIIGNAMPMDFGRELMIYRIAQEALHNAVKHSKSAIIDIMLQFNTENFLMRIKDYGIGFYPEEAIQKGRNGLQNIHQRAQSLDADLTIDSLPGQGCCIWLSISKPY